MSLQDDVNQQVANIHAAIDESIEAADGVPAHIDAVDGEQAIDFGAIADGFVAVADGLLFVADAIDALMGDSAQIRAAAANVQTVAEGIEDGSVSFVQVKAALTGLAAAVAPQGGASNAMAGLLLDQSNFGGEEQ